MPGLIKNEFDSVVFDVIALYQNADLSNEEINRSTIEFTSGEVIHRVWAEQAEYGRREEFFGSELVVIISQCKYLNRRHEFMVAAYPNVENAQQYLNSFEIDEIDSESSFYLIYALVFSDHSKKMAILKQIWTNPNRHKLLGYKKNEPKFKTLRDTKKEMNQSRLSNQPDDLARLIKELGRRK